MGQHSAKPEHLSKKVRTRANQVKAFCIHFIVEGTAGFAAIIVFEAYRNNWLNMLGTHHAMTIYTYYTF